MLQTSETKQTEIRIYSYCLTDFSDANKRRVSENITQVIKRLTCFREVLGSNIGWGNNYPY
jgi:flagellin-specific chaperone FliS